VAVSAGILLYRRRPAGLEVLIAHPGGPLWAGRQDGAWSIPKGIVESGETSFEVARREFREETGHEPPADPGAYLPLGEVRTPTGKRIVAWAAEGDLDPATATSNTFEMPWPPGSGRRQAFPEIDRVAWVSPTEARRLLHAAQAAFVDRLEALLAEEAQSVEDGPSAEDGRAIEVARSVEDGEPTDPAARSTANPPDEPARSTANPPD
jgi:predicted NUDIX family NTP pyrophosphohydrolase